MYQIKNYNNLKKFISKVPPLVEKTEEEILREEYKRRLTHRKRTKNFRVHPQHKCRDCKGLISIDKEYQHHIFCSACWEKRKRRNEGVRK